MKRDSHNPAGRSQVAKSGLAFTIVELLVAMGIMAILISLIVPSVHSVRRAMKSAASMATIRLLDGACQVYHNDFNDYPPSRDPAYMDGATPWQGSEILTLLLTGYGPDDGDDGSPRTGLATNVPTDLRDDDGQGGFGFRVLARGKVYGPYSGAEKVPVARSAAGIPRFVDAFGNPILYYRWRETAPNTKVYIYYFDDNVFKGADPADTGWPTSQADLTGPTGYLIDQALNRYYRDDFVLLTPGPNGPDDQFGRPAFAASPGGADDITNLFLGR